MDWQPISRKDLDQLMQEALDQADDDVLAAWERIKVEPHKWQCPPIGDAGGGFWVIAVNEKTVTWYDDIEDDFTSSSWTKQGTIDGAGHTFEDFSQFLRSLVPIKEPHKWLSSTLPSEVPKALGGRGRIVKRQTSYWTLTDATGLSWRVHFIDKAEMHFTTPVYASLMIIDDHPLLEDHSEPWASLYPSSKPKNPDALLAALRSLVIERSKGHRHFEQYANKGFKLTDGNGLLMEGPISLVQAVQDLLGGAGVASSKLGIGQYAKHPLKVLLLDSSYVVAKEFRFELRFGNDQ